MQTMASYKSAEQIEQYGKRIDFASIAEGFFSLFRPISLDEKTSEDLYSFGYTLYQQDRFADAAIVFQYLLLCSKLHPRTSMALGACCQAQMNFETGALLYQFSMDLGETDPALHLYLGECQIYMGKELEAVEEFKLAIELTRDLPEHIDIFEKASGLIALVESVGHA